MLETDSFLLTPIPASHQKFVESHTLHTTVRGWVKGNSNIPNHTTQAKSRQRLLVGNPLNLVIGDSAKRQ